MAARETVSSMVPTKEWAIEDLATEITMFSINTWECDDGVVADLLSSHLPKHVDLKTSDGRVSSQQALSRLLSVEQKDIDTIRMRIGSCTVSRLSQPRMQAVLTKGCG